ncbi:MAG: Ig-like domain-containing protein [Lachnospiraceae bacterium]|nr:Ig-like domain-containing protein [Lachnospiraceae bacterium]
MSVSLKVLNEDGTIVKESAVSEERYYVDEEAPQASFQMSGNLLGETVYASGLCTVSAFVEADGKSGLKKASYKIVPCDKNGSATESAASGTWIECSAAVDIQVSGEGLYRVYIKTEDMVGNTTFSGSRVICVDNTLPVISIAGIEDQSANSGSAKLRISCTDSHYKEGSLLVNICGINQGNAPTVSLTGNDGSCAWVEYQDFPPTQEYDDVYEVTVTAEDLAGNKQEKTVRFSINRFGSVYDISSETKTMLDQYFLSKAESVVFYETNIDYVGESKIYCRFNGALRELSAGRDYQVSMEGNDRTWKRYCYTIPSEYFSNEGVYELLLASGDAAENTSDTGIQQKRVTFVLDYSDPTCTVSGIEENGVYEEEKVTVCVVPDDNIGLDCIRIYHNSELLLENSSQPKSGETIKITLVKEQEWQTVQIWLRDKAGNEYWSEEIPVYIGAGQTDVPVYQKQRPSAMEIAKAESADSAEYEELMAAYGMTAEAAVETNSDAAVESLSYSSTTGEQTDHASKAENGFFKTTSEGGSLQTEKRSRNIGWVMLGIGLLMFAGTVIYYRKHPSEKDGL